MIKAVIMVIGSAVALYALIPQCLRTYFQDLPAGFPANLVVFEYPGFGHNDITDVGTDLIREKIRSFISKP